MTVREALSAAAARLKAAGVESAPLEAQLLLAYVLRRDRVWLTVNRDRAVAAADRARFQRMVRQRCIRKPLQQILGETEFYGRRILVDRHVLVPRPETELLVGQVVERWRTRYRTILDIGTGSGCIAVVLAGELPRARITATDISARALAVARNVIVSNPPYIPTASIPGLQPEVAQFEPVTALDGGSDGLLCYRRIAEGIGTRLRPGGLLAVEVGDGQASAVAELARCSLPGAAVETVEDYCGTPRIVLATVPQR
ncbi:MAG: peptide chain release factor N(5)-glutamine methyltransferase [Candidatus Edwardsbacteria bacterium]|nr:peptide chain release factor N(5)-glutamine methyltransferase [Candidatus Edwardsbacteria bacterium]